MKTWLRDCNIWVKKEARRSEQCEQTLEHVDVTCAGVLVMSEVF